MNNVSKLPTISFLIPTLNAASFLEKCLPSIFMQDYPKEKIEVIIADGGSIDNTLSIVNKFKVQSSKFKVRVFDNPLKTAEAGKAVALKHAQGELVALVDSDNILPDKDWLKQMVAPFVSPKIVGSEPWKYVYRKEDGFIDRYCALMGMNDPYCFFLGNYDKYNFLTGKWTSLPIDSKDHGDWIEIIFNKESKIPTIGANGTVLRRDFLLQEGWNKNYFFDVDVLAGAAEKNPIFFAKVKNGIIHLYCGKSIRRFFLKQKRRIRDYLYYKRNNVRTYPWQKKNTFGMITFVFSCMLFFPLFYHSLKGYFKKKDLAWFFHPLACWITLFVYFEGIFSSLFTVKEMSRESWKQ